MRSPLVDNPFRVLGLPTGASRIEVEREAARLLGMLALGLEGADRYDSPLGPRPRTPELVREAVATLRDPARRLAAELWAGGSTETAVPPVTAGAPVDAAPGPAADAAGGAPAAPAPAAQPRIAGWPGALRRLGWSRR